MRTFGIDVSRWQGDFDFSRAKSEGVKYVIIKGGGADGGLYRDMRFEENYRNALSAGLPVGAYFFGAAKNAAAAREEARYFAKLLAGKSFPYPVFYDAESDAMPKNKKALTDVVTAFCTEMERLGYWCGFYTNYDWYLNRLDGASLAARFSFWCAAWMDKCPANDAQMWQFGGSTNLIRENTVAGVVCDQDYSFRDFPTMIRAKGLNGTKAAPKPDADTVLKCGDRVRMKEGAPIYGTDVPFAPFVYSSTLYVREIAGDRVVVSTVATGPVTGAVARKYLTKVK